MSILIQKHVTELKDVTIVKLGCGCWSLQISQIFDCERKNLQHKLSLTPLLLDAGGLGLVTVELHLPKIRLNALLGSKSGTCVCLMIFLSCWSVWAPLPLAATQLWATTAMHTETQCMAWNLRHSYAALSWLIWSGLWDWRLWTTSLAHIQTEPRRHNSDAHATVMLNSVKGHQLCSLGYSSIWAGTWCAPLSMHAWLPAAPLGLRLDHAQLPAASARTNKWIDSA